MVFRGFAMGSSQAGTLALGSIYDTVPFSYLLWSSSACISVLSSLSSNQMELLGDSQAFYSNVFGPTRNQYNNANVEISFFVCKQGFLDSSR
jgi:hypothetical protein